MKLRCRPGGPMPPGPPAGARDSLYVAAAFPPEKNPGDATANCTRQGEMFCEAYSLELGKTYGQKVGLYAILFEHLRVLVLEQKFL